MKGHGRFLFRKQAIERRGVGLHTAGELGAGNLTAFHLALNLPRHDTLERPRFAFGEQTILLEEVVEIRTEGLLFYGLIVADA